MEKILFRLVSENLTFDMKCVTKAKNVMNAKDKSCWLKVRTPPGHKGYPGDTPCL